MQHRTSEDAVPIPLTESLVAIVYSRRSLSSTDDFLAEELDVNVYMPGAGGFDHYASVLVCVNRGARPNATQILAALDELEGQIAKDEN